MWVTTLVCFITLGGFGQETGPGAQRYKISNVKIAGNEENSAQAILLDSKSGKSWNLKKNVHWKIKLGSY